MAEKEERIHVTKYPYPCDVRCKIEGRYPKCMETCVDLEEYNNSFSRQEAIERMAKAICKISCACKYYACGNCTEFLEHYTPDLAEAALNALLEGK